MNTPNVFRNANGSKIQKLMNGTRGYESENEISRDSTTTSNSNMLACGLK